MIFLFKLCVAIPTFFCSLLFSQNEVPSVRGIQATTLTYLLLAAWSTIVKDIRSSASSGIDVEKHLELGKKLMAAGQFADALSHYHLAIEGNPNSYMTYFRRATVYMAMGKSKAAVPDLDKVLDLKPDFNAARAHRANVKLKQGKLIEAKEDYEIIFRQDPSYSEAQIQIGLIPTIIESIEQAKVEINRGDYNMAVHLLNKPIEVCPWDSNLHELRASAFEILGDRKRAIQDIRPTVKLVPDNTGGYLKLSTLLYQEGEAEDSLKEIRECLKLDADHKDCLNHYKKVKKLAKLLNDIEDAKKDKRWDDCISKTNQVSKAEPSETAYILKVQSHYCHCYAEGKNLVKGLQYCNEILSVHDNNIDALCNRAELYILNEQFEEAVADYKKAESIAGELQKVQEGLQKAQKLLKQTKKRDYYKILGIKRTATKIDITKAYRKLAAKWHPDQYHGNDKKMAENKFIDIAAAKEVLSDPEKRAKFDQGEDPLDPEQQAQSGGPQWHQGFNPFGQGGFQFKFHFN